MSKVKAATIETESLDAVDTNETVKVEESETKKETVTTSTTSTTATKPKKITIYKYLEMCPQEKYIDGLLRKKFAGKWQTKEEWDVIVYETIHKKIE